METCNHASNGSQLRTRQKRTTQSNLLPVSASWNVGSRRNELATSVRREITCTQVPYTCMVTGCMVTGCMVTGCMVTGCMVTGCMVTGCMVTGCMVTGCMVTGCAREYVMRAMQTRWDTYHTLACQNVRRNHKRRTND